MIFFYQRLARWLQPEPVVDVEKTLLVEAPEAMPCYQGWPTILTVITHDQYGEVVHVPNMRVSQFFILVHSSKMIFYDLFT